MISVPKNETELEELLSRPTGRLIECLGKRSGDIVLLGAAGKIGVTLAQMAVRAVKASGRKSTVFAVSRFSDPVTRRKIEEAGATAIPCDLLDPEAVADLPEARDVIFLAGRKFGTTGSQELTWATNTIAPANVARRYAKSDIVVYSTGCVYDYRTAASGGSTESDPPEPTGEYAQSTLGRERVFEYYARIFGTRVCLFRLNYAIDLRYGVLRDIADKLTSGTPIDISTGSFNCIWQGDVLERTLLALELCASPPDILNVTGPETISLRYAALELARRMGKEAIFTGVERDDARSYLNNAQRSFGLFGYPEVSLDEMFDLTAAWVASGGASLGKPTHFESIDGKY